MAYWEWAAAIAGAVSVYLSTRQNIWSWPTAIVNVSLSTFIFFQSGLYSGMGLQVVYLVLSIYGWYQWLHGGAERTPLRVSRASPRAWIASGVAAMLFYAGIANYTSGLSGVSLPYLDSGLTTVSLIAQWMMTRKILESWVLWILVDVVYVPMYIYMDLYVIAGLYAVFLVLAVTGFVQWRRSYRADRGGGGGGAASRTGARVIKVVLTGSESTGKSELARALGEHFRAPVSAEFVREYAAERGGQLEFSDHGPIARGQMAQEDAAIARAAGMVILDTDLVSTLVYCEHYFGRAPAWIEAEARLRAGDLYLLLAPDVPWIPDGVRDRGDRREEMHALFRARLVALGLPYAEIRGSREERQASAVESITALGAS
ncbi:MAG: nicotinamide riboside transporter PnuC [Gemmatimonadaceae bacterium]